MVTIPTIPSIPKNITCKFGYYPIVVFATKGGKPLSGATVKFESWTLKIGKITLKRPATRTTNATGIAHACFLFLSYGKVSIYHPNEDFGSGKGKWKTLGNIRSLRKPTSFTAVVVPPTPKPYKPPVVSPLPIPPIPTPPVIPVPVIPTPTIPIIPIEPVPGLPTGRVGAVVRLTMMDGFKNRPTFVGNAYWRCMGISKSSAKIASVALPKSPIETHGIGVGKTTEFKNGMSVKVIRVLLKGRESYADVIITPTPGISKPPVTREPPISIVPEKTYTRITRILAEGQDLPKANNGEIVRITAESYCKVNGKIDKSKVPSLLIVDGVVADRKPVVDGVVAYEWAATSIPSRHTICVQINPTDTCRSIGRDCKKISVSSRTLDLSEQLLRERTSAKEQRELMRQSRSRLREEIVGAIREAPVYEAPTVPTPTPTPPIVIPIEKPPAPQTGNIKLTGLPLSIPKDIPAYIYVDNINKGSVSILPVTLSLIPVGTHSVYVMAGEFKSISKSVDVIANETSTVSLL